MKWSLIYALIFIVYFSSCSKDKETKVQLAPPVIHSISPQEGRPGTIVTIEGENFSRLRVDNKILFNGVEAEIIHFNETTMHVYAPQGSSDGPVAANIAGQSVEGPAFHFIQPPAPTGETVIVKVLSIGGHATKNATANTYLNYYADLAKEKDVDFVVMRELDSMTTRSGPTDRPKVFSERSGLEHYVFARAQAYQNGYLGVGVYSKHNVTEELTLNLGNNRTIGVMKVQITPKSQIAIAGLQIEDVIAQQAKRTDQAGKVNTLLHDVMVPTILAGGIFMLGQTPLEDPTFKLFQQEDFVPGCTSCEFTSVSGTTPVIADFISYRWAREARVIKYELLPTASGSDRKPAYMEIEFKL